MALKGWKSRLLGDLLDVQNGSAFASELFSKHEGMPLIRIRDLKNGYSTEVLFKGKYDKRFVVRSGDFLIGMDGEFRCYEWRGQDALLNQRVCRLIDYSEEICPEFIFYGINRHLRIIEVNTPYVTVRHLSAKKIKGINFSYPSLAEQRRIVARIKECLERVEEIEGLRSEVLEEAINLAPSLYAAMENGDKWPKKTIGELVTNTRNGRSIRQENENATGHVLSLSAVHDVSLNLKERKPIILPDNIAAQYKIVEGDVFVSRSNTRELVGLASVATDSPEQLIYPDLLIKLNPKKDLICPRFLAYALRTPESRRQIKDRAVGTSQSMVKISGQRLKEVKIPVPPLDVQDSLIKRFDELHDLSSDLLMDLKFFNADALRQSILRKAFAGEL